MKVAGLIAGIFAQIGVLAAMLVCTKHALWTHDDLIMCGLAWPLGLLRLIAFQRYMDEKGALFAGIMDALWVFYLAAWFIPSFPILLTIFCVIGLILHGTSLVGVCVREPKPHSEA